MHEHIHGGFYEKKLLVVPKATDFFIEDMLDTRGKKFLLVGGDILVNSINGLTQRRSPLRRTQISILFKYLDHKLELIRNLHEFVMTYITLASDASYALFPENKIGSFRVKLPRALEYDRSKHLIGLTHISFPQRFYNIQNGSFKLKVSKSLKKHIETAVSGEPSFPTKKVLNVVIKTEIPAGSYRRKSFDYHYK